MLFPRILVASGEGGRDFVFTLLSDDAFNARFGTEQACRDFLFRHRWPDGFSCTLCGPASFRWLDTRRMRCLSCHKDRSLTAGTILERTRKPLRLWFKAAFLMAQHGASARMLEERLHLTYKVAWTWAQKLRRLMELETTLEEAVPPYVPGPGEEEDGGPAATRRRRNWDALHGRFVWGAHVPDVSRCCRRLVAGDWGERGETGGSATVDLFTACSGSLSVKHLDVYMRQTEFRTNYKRTPERDRAAVLIGRFARIGPTPYHAIRGDRPEGDPIGFRRGSVA